MRVMLLSFVFLGLAACRAEAPSGTSPDVAAKTPPPAEAPVPATAPPPADHDGDAGAAGTDPAGAASDPAGVLAGKVWRVERRSDGGEVGSTYAFLDDGTLVVDSPNGTPMTGSWQVRDGALSLTEEGVAYPAEVVVRDASHVTLRSRNPGGVVEIALVAAPEVPLPQP
jgi:hypothetical protein